MRSRDSHLPLEQRDPLPCFVQGGGMRMVEHYGEGDEDHFHPSGEYAERGEVHYAVFDPIENPPPVHPLHK